MTRKDYELIAKAIRDTQDRIAGDSQSLDQIRGVRRTATHLAVAFGTTNPRFDQTRFLKACGYGA